MAYFTVEELRVASPCPIEWSSMDGDDLARRCGVCEKHVYNLSNLTREEGNLLILEKEGNLCVRYYRRFDGSVLTADCPVGLRKLKKQYLWARAKFVAATIMILGAIAGLTGSCDEPTVLHGLPVIPDSLIKKDTSHRGDSIIVPAHTNATP